jgi:hypothetical protein
LQKSETEVHSIDNESKNIHGIRDNTSINSKSRCMKNSLINVNTVHMKHNMDDRSNKCVSTTFSESSLAELYV